MSRTVKIHRIIICDLFSGLNSFFCVHCKRCSWADCVWVARVVHKPVGGGVFIKGTIIEIILHIVTKLFNTFRKTFYCRNRQPNTGWYRNNFPFSNICFCVEPPLASRPFKDDCFRIDVRAPKMIVGFCCVHIYPLSTLNPSYYWVKMAQNEF